MSVIFNPDQAQEALKDFDAQVIEMDYSLEPFGITGAEGIERKAKQLCLKLQADIYEKPQYVWLPPSRVKKTKWVEFLQALLNCGALNETKTEGATDEERIRSFGTSLLGMKFHFEEKQFESLVKEAGAYKKFSLLVPVKYLGKLPITVAGEVKQATIGEELK